MTDQRERAIQATEGECLALLGEHMDWIARQWARRIVDKVEHALAQSDEGVPQPVREAIARLREPYTYAYGDSGEAYMDGKILADFIDPSGLSREGEGT